MSRFVLFSYRGSHKVCRTPDFALGLEPVLKVLAREGAAFYIDFVSATVIPESFPSQLELPLRGFVP